MDNNPLKDISHIHFCCKVMRMYCFVCLVCFCHCLVTRYVWVCVLSLKLLDRGTGCLRGLMSLRWTSDSWIGLFSLPLPGGFAVSSILRQIAKKEINGQWEWQKGRDIERGRRLKRTRGGQLPSAHFLLMDKANSRRQCCRQIWIFFITWTHALIC